jgi:N-acetyl sugar amidotransferase
MEDQVLAEGERSTIAIISSNYPSHDSIYGDVFVHTRAKYYAQYYHVIVLGYLPQEGATIAYEYDGISVKKTHSLEELRRWLSSDGIMMIAVHFMEHAYIDLLVNLGKPLAVFIHGYEALSWRRRLMNYNAPGALPYLIKYVRQNKAQLEGMRRFLRVVKDRPDVSLIHVSKWLKQAVEKDLNLRHTNSMIIPNGINTSLFQFQRKPSELRKKVLLIRSFKARNYANDIAVDTVLALSKRAFFKELDFSFYGEGFLFEKLTSKIKHFDNVKLYNCFVLNEAIPKIHKDFGIFLCPSKLDTQGVSMCEAMASGLVPITCSVGGIPEYATHAESAFMIKDAQSAADAIEKLYYDEALFHAMSHAARKEIETKCDLTDTADREISLFRSLVGANQSTHTGAYQQCTRCVLDTNDDPGIQFDHKGICSYCRGYDRQAEKLKTGAEAAKHLTSIVATIKAAGKGKDYDCIIGLSGGVDSTYLAHLAHSMGLRPLAVHFDNGWNSELAVSNIEKIVQRLDIPLYTYVIDWEEFKDLQLSMIKASVVDIEMVTDHAIITKLYDLALKHGIKYILSGTNVVTESVLPTPWIHNKKDHINIRNIHARFGSVPLKDYPLFESKRKVRVAWAGIQSVSLLDYVPYEKKAIKAFITEKLGWRDYGGKHYESVFTRFYQGYILPTKFRIDKRKAHLSNLICSKQITKAEAIEELQTPIYPPQYFTSDYEFVLKKLDLTEQQFQQYMKAPIQTHESYGVERSFYDRFPLIKLVRPLWLSLKKLKGV